MYGIDIYGEAIEKARVNTALAGLRVNYINRDFFEFRHEYLFDEIITDLPQVTQAKDRRQIQELYAQFFAYAGKVLKKEAVMVLYASEPEFVRKEVKKYREYHICESYVINERQGTTVFVIEVKG
jgi:tRNA G10  N-methylase Trm11